MGHCTETPHPRFSAHAGRLHARLDGRRPAGAGPAARRPARRRRRSAAPVRGPRQRQPRRSRRPGQGAGLHPSRRLPGGLEARPARPVSAAPAGHGDRSQGSRRRLPLADRADRHHHPARRAAVPHLRRAGAIRARVDPGTGAGRACRRAPPGPPRRPSRRHRPRKARRRNNRARCRRQQGGGVPNLRHPAQYLVAREERVFSALRALPGTVEPLVP